MTDDALPVDPALFWGSADPLGPVATPVPTPDAEAGEPALDALDERGQPPLELGGGGLRRELAAMYAAVRADALARLRWLSR